MDPGFGFEWTGGGELVVRLDALPRHVRETRNSEAARRETMLNAFQQIQHNLDALASSKTSRSSSTMPRLPRISPSHFHYRFIKAASEIVRGQIVSRKRTLDGQVDQW